MRPWEQDELIWARDCAKAGDTPEEVAEMADRGAHRGAGVDHHRRAKLVIDFHLATTGVTRHVLLLGRWAIKLPRLNHGWRGFLCGLMCNMQEAEFSSLGDHRLCPVVAAVPGGWLVVMRRARVMTPAEFSALDWPRFVAGGKGLAQVPAEAKADSFGWLDGRVVAIDYGS